MIPLPPRSTRTYTPFTYTALVRSMLPFCGQQCCAERPAGHPNSYRNRVHPHQENGCDPPPLRRLPSLPSDTLWSAGRSIHFRPGPGGGKYAWLVHATGRSEERRVGHEGVSTCEFRWSEDNEKKKIHTYTKTQ